MKYNYALIVGLLVSVHVLMGSEKDIWAINNIPKDPPYEKCEEVKGILKKYAIDSTQKEWKISILSYDPSYYKGNSSKICLSYDEFAGSSKKIIVCGAGSTDRLLRLPGYCNNKAVHLESKINELEASLQPRLMDYASRSAETCGGIFLLGVFGGCFSKFLSYCFGKASDNRYIKTALFAGGSLIAAFVSMNLLLSAAYETYSCIQHNDNRMRNSEKIQSSIDTYTAQKDKWESVQAELSTIIALAKTF